VRCGLHKFEILFTKQVQDIAARRAIADKDGFTWSVLKPNQEFIFFDYDFVMSITFRAVMRSATKKIISIGWHVDSYDVSLKVTCSELR
jgi:hypothetical protein